MASTALPLSTHNFLPDTAIERCLVEGDSTLAEKPGATAATICQAGFTLNLFFSLFVLSAGGGSCPERGDAVQAYGNNFKV